MKDDVIIDRDCRVKQFIECFQTYFDAYYYFIKNILKGHETCVLLHHNVKDGVIINRDHRIEDFIECFQKHFDVTYYLIEKYIKRP